MTPAGAARRRDGIILSILLIATAAAFTPGLAGGFVYDDHRFIVDNVHVRDLGNVPGFFTDPTTVAADVGLKDWTDIYRPLRTVSFALDWTLFGEAAAWYRIENLLWHLGAVLLAWLLLRRLLGSGIPAAVGAGVFALHPVQAATVSCVSSRGDLMAAVFLLWAALELLRESPDRRGTVVGVVLYAVALLSKESSIAFLALVPAYDRMFSPRGRANRWGTYGALAAVTVAFLALRFGVADAQGELVGGDLLGAGSAVVLTVGAVLFPMRLLPFTGDVFTPERIWVWTGGLVLVASGLLVLLALVRGRRAPVPWFGLFWAAACFAPVSGIVPMKSLAECRFAYLPLLGVGLMSAALADRRPGRALGAVVLVLLASLTLAESAVWRDGPRLWRTAVDREVDVFGEPGPHALLGLGVAERRAGNLDGVVDAFEKSFTMSGSGLAMMHLELALQEAGRAHLDAGRYAEATRALNRLLAWGCPGAATVAGLLDEPEYRGIEDRDLQWLRANAHLLLFRSDRAEACFREMRGTWPEDTAVALQLGLSLLGREAFEESIPHLEAATVPEDASFKAWISLARAYRAAGREMDAKAAAEAALHRAGTEAELREARAFQPPSADR